MGAPPDGRAVLEHVVTVVLKQLKDTLLAKALDKGGIYEMFDVLSLSQSNHDDLSRKALRYPYQLATKEC